MTKPPSPMHSKPVQVRMKAETHQWIHEQAQAQERSANWIINRVLEDARAKKSGPEGHLTAEASGDHASTTSKGTS